MTPTSRDRSRVYINAVKGIAIFLMLWGHCIQYCVAGSGLDYFENPVFKVIYTFHMPLFMLISGYLFRFSFEKRERRELVIHRCKPLLHTIVFCSIFLYYITYGISGVLTRQPELLLNGAWLSALPRLWFLWSVLAASLGVALICKTFRKLRLQIPLLILYSAAVLLFPNAQECLYLYPYFVIGFYYGKYQERMPNPLKKARYLTFILFPLMCCFFKRDHYIYIGRIYGSGQCVAEQLLINGYRWLIGLVGSVFVLTVVDLVFPRKITAGSKMPVGDALAKLGEKSLQIYALSTTFLSSVLRNGFPYVLKLFHNVNVFTQNMLLYNFVFTFLLAAAYAFALLKMTHLFEKWRISGLLFGK